MTNYLSYKLKVVSFVLMCMVVLLHAQIINLSPPGLSVFIQRLFSGQITRVAVSFFFIISGFLFAYNIKKENALSLFRTKISKRLKTLLIPYILWSFICLCAVGGIQYLIPSMSVETTPVYKYNLTDYYNEVIVNPTIAYQLWFLRDLFIVSLFSPFLYWLLKNLRELVVAIVIILWFNWWHIGFLSVTSITFFTIGMYLSMYGKKWVEYKFHNTAWWILPIVWIIYCIVLVLIDKDSYLLHFIDKILGILSIWILYDLIYNIKMEQLYPIDIMSFAFFIYITHEPILTITKQIYIRTIGVDTVFTSLLFYFICPIFIISICVLLGKFLRVKYTALYRLISGGR